MKFIRPQHFDVVSEDIIKMLLKLGFWLLPFGAYKIYEILDNLITYHG